MWNKLFSLCLSIGHFENVVTDVTNLIVRYEKDFEKDSDAWNAFIDTIVEILQSHKH